MIKRLLDLVVFLSVYLYIYKNRWQNISRRKKFINSLFYIYMCVVLSFTVLPLPYLGFDFHFSANTFFRVFNPIPFKEIFCQTGYGVEDVVLNILMTVPLGILLPLKNSEKRCKNVVLFSFLMSVSIELFQLFTGVFMYNCRSCDVTDVITNTFGGFLGYCLYKPFRGKIQNHLKHYKEKDCIT